MKCPECGYTSFDYLEECKKCGAVLSPVPIFKYLYEDELSTEVVIDRSAQPVADDVLVGVKTVGAMFELSPAGEPSDEELPEGELENFLAFERDLGEEITEQEEQREEEQQERKSKEKRRVHRPCPMEWFPRPSGRDFSRFPLIFCLLFALPPPRFSRGANLIGETFFPGFGEFVSIWGWICLCAYVLATTYFIFLPSWCGTTLGNSAVGIRVVMRDGSPAGFQTNFLRWVGWIFSVATAFAGFALSMLDPQRKTLSDRLCGTFVVRA